MPARSSRSFVADIRVSDLRPFERRIPELLAAALNKEALPIDVLGRLDPAEVQLAKTASRHVLGVMNQMAFEIGWHVDQAGGLESIEIDELNSHLRRSLHTKDGTTEYRSNSCTNDSKPRNEATQNARRTSREARNSQAPRPEFPAPTGTEW